VSLPDDAASLLLAPDEALLELSYQLDVVDVGELAVTTICALDLVRRLGDDAGVMPTGPDPVVPATPAGGGMGRVPSELLDQAPDLFAAPTGRTGADLLGTPSPARGSAAGGMGMTPGSATGFPMGSSGVDFGDATIARPVQFQQFAEGSSGESAANIDLLMDVNLKVSVRLGQATMSIRDILELGPGFVIELDKLAGEPVDILVNDKPIARGEVVVVDENFGVRVVDIISPAKRVSALR
jgi:flagellar motor switch protein FliN/FliY